MNLKKLINRRSFIASGFGAIGLGGYMRFWEPGAISVTEHKCVLNQANSLNPIRVLHLSDFHASDVVSLEFISESIELGRSCKPDLICLTGDFITSTYGDFAGYSGAMKALSQTAPTFACVGNHDGGWWARHRGYPTWRNVEEMLEGAGITLLHNRSTVIKVKSEMLQIMGLGDLWARECDPQKAFRNVDPSINTLVLSHNPDSKELLDQYKWQLMLCGHTHGGQLRIPLVGTPFAPVRDHRYVSGLNPWQDRWIHTTCGVGNLHGLRLNCPPEVSLLEIS